ncbi:Hypothetical predicted protein [Paramuricea clavata]|uniref:Uncharacterized protein n=1 Tax=Paramuricea clavata TaxID=317549 RepID=A0A6S7GB25_PARCT|nr:Hypothetical predicted protein [Paramuricea clavata]
MRKEKIKKEVIDLTKNGIDDDVKKYLALGPDFSTRVPYEKIISETDKMCSVIEKEGELKEIDKEIVERELSDVHESMRMILEKARHRKCQTNLTKDEMNG